MCSELTPRARIPNTRIPQLMQPCCQWYSEQFCIMKNCTDIWQWRLWPDDKRWCRIKMHWYMTKICGNLRHISKRRELVPYFGKSLAQVVIRGSHRSWVAYESWHDKCQKIYFWEPSFIYKNLYSDRNSGRVVEKMFNGWGAVRFSGIFQSVGSRRHGRWILTLPPWGALKSGKLQVSMDGWENIWCWG